MTSFIKRHSVPIYFVLAFALTWGCMALMIGPGGFPITEEQFETVGPLVYVGMLVGPSTAGILLIALVYGRAGFRDLRSRLFRWRVGARWYAIALLTTPLMAMAILLALSLFSSEFVPGVFKADDKFALLLTGLTVGLVVGFFEELGWTGFVVPRMRRRHSVFTTGIVVGLLWGAWHFLPFWEDDTFSGAFPLILLLGRLFSWLPPYRVLMVWVHERTESLFVVMIMHASLVATLQGVVPAELEGGALLTWIFVWAVALWILVTVGVVWRHAPHYDTSLTVEGTTL